MAKTKAVIVVGLCACRRAAELGRYAKGVEMKKIVVFVSLVVILLVPAAQADEPKVIIKSFFDTFLKGNGPEAVDGFFSTNPIVAQKAQQLQLLKSQLLTVTQIYGMPFGYELVVEEVLSPSLRRYVYITKHEYHPISWEIYIYKPKDRWIASQLLFVDQFQVIGVKK